MEFKIVVTDVEDCAVLSKCDAKLLTKILHRGLKDYFYRKEYNKNQQNVLKEFTRLKREAGLKGRTLEQMLRSVNEEVETEDLDLDELAAEEA